MKGWIKVHDISEDEHEVFIKASEIVALERLYDEKGVYTGLITNRRTACYTVSESPEEVLALINEAENGEEETTPVEVIEADKLLEWLEDMQEEAKHERAEALSDTYRARYQGYGWAIAEVIDHVECETFLADKPADTEEE